MDGIFVTGIDTSVGKTAVCAGLMKLLHGAKKATYWKPIQTGTIVGDDTTDVKAATELSDDSYVEPTYRFAEPVSPHFAAKKWGKSIDLEAVVRQYTEVKRTGRFLVVEGAGGLLVPLNEQQLQKDLIKKLGLPLIIVGTDRVGAINQTLLTLNACRAENIPVLGIILMKSRGNLGNAEAITHFGKVEILGEFPPVEDTMTLVALIAGNPRLRKLLGVPLLPA